MRRYVRVCVCVCVVICIIISLYARNKISLRMARFSLNSTEAVFS